VTDARRSIPSGRIVAALIAGDPGDRSRSRPRHPSAGRAGHRRAGLSGGPSRALAAVAWRGHR
jgi:hypothetical protein